MKGKCKTCGEVITSRKSDKNSAQSNFLKAMRKHYLKKHPKTLGKRISDGLKNANNPDGIFKAFLQSFGKGVTQPVDFAVRLPKKDWDKITPYMDVAVGFMTPEVQATYEIIKATKEKVEELRTRAT